MSDPSLFSPIDGDITVEGRRYLGTFKSGPWTMNQSHANEMMHRFPEIHRTTGAEIFIGVTYGTRQRLNNKPALVQNACGPYVHVLVGKELWEFITGVHDAHLHVFRAIREAQNRFSLAHGGKTFFEHTIEARLRLAQSFREHFELTGTDDDMWDMVFKRAF